MSSKVNKLKKNVDLTNKAISNFYAKKIRLALVRDIFVVISLILNLAVTALHFIPHHSDVALTAEVPAISAPVVRKIHVDEDIAELLNIKRDVSEGQFEDAIISWFNSNYIKGVSHESE